MQTVSVDHLCYCAQPATYVLNAILKPILIQLRALSQSSYQPQAEFARRVSLTPRWRREAATLTPNHISGHTTSVIEASGPATANFSVRLAAICLRSSANTFSRLGAPGTRGLATFATPASKYTRNVAYAHQRHGPDSNSSSAISFEQLSTFWEGHCSQTNLRVSQAH